MVTVKNFKKVRTFFANLVRANIGMYILFVSLSIVAAIANMGIIYMINRILKNFFSNTETSSKIYFPVFILAILIFFVSRWVVSRNIIGFTQNLLRKMRLEILQMVLQSSYFPLIKGKARIHMAMTRDAGNIVQASVSIVDMVTNIVIVLICFIYMAVL